MNASRDVSPATTPARDAARRATGLIVAVLLLAAALRVLEAWKLRLWFDEIYVVMVARQRLSDVLRTAAADIHPPLHFALRWAWQHLGGEGDLWLKSLSILCGLISIAGAYALGRRMFGAAAALLAAALLGISPPHIHYSQEVEVYGPLWMWVVLAVGFGWRWVRGQRRGDAVAFAVCSLAALETDYLAAFVLATLALWGTIVLRRTPGALRGWVGLYALLALLFLPQVAIWAQQFVREGSGSFFRFARLGDLFAVSRSISFNSRYLVPVLGLLALLPLLRGPRRQDAALLWMLITLPMLSARAWPFAVTRDFLYAAPFALLLVAAGATSLPGRWARGIVGVLLVALGLRAAALHRKFAEPVALEKVAAVIDANATPSDLVLHAESHSLLYFLFYAPKRRERILVNEGQRVPYFDGGLVIPDSAYITPGEWAREREAGRPWWGVALDRALATGGHVFRASAWGAARMDSTAHLQVWRIPPVTLWQGTP